MEMSADRLMWPFFRNMRRGEMTAADTGQRADHEDDGHEHQQDKMLHLLGHRHRLAITARPFHRHHGAAIPLPTLVHLGQLAGSTMQRGRLFAVCVLCWSVSVCVVEGIQRADLFPYGPLSGDLILAEGDDETSKVLTLPRPLYFYDSLFSHLYVATNGIISAQDLPMEKQYVDDGFPTDFPAVAPFLADIDTTGGRGQIYYRVTETPSVLNKLAQEVHRGFPDAKFTPTHVVVATWENVAAYKEPSRTTAPSSKVNTFQAVIGYDEIDSYTLFLYPEGGLNFFGTRPKESYNVEIELPARVGFSRGEITYLIFSRTEGPHYSVTSDEQSVKNLYQVGNTGIPGVWLFHTGNQYSLHNIVPASISGILATPPAGGHGLSLDTTTPEYAEFEEYPDNTFDPDNLEEDDDYPLTGEDSEFQPAPAGGDQSEPLRPSLPDAPSSPSEESDQHGREDVPLTSEPRFHQEPAGRQYAPANPDSQDQQPQAPLEVVDVYPPQRNEPPLSPGGHVVSVDEDDVDFDTGVIQYTTENKETCARFQQQCSQNAFCSDYSTGYCCHCQPGFYGNGRHCLPEGAPQRVSGKVSGTVIVGSTPVDLNNIDLHAYIVVGDGRAYTAISEVPEPVGWALMPLAPIGELFGWLFALELPNSQAGFKITGAEFTRHAEVVFYPGNQRLSIIQTGRGLDDHNHLTVDTAVNGNVPFLPPGAEITMDPFKETYQYYPSVATSTSVREYTVVSADRGSESFSFQLKQNITYRDCRHDNRASTPETLQITMERVFVMYVKEERILRYAITNKISPVGVEPTGPELVNPCYAGNHDCDTTAQCIPQEGQDFQCQCATGYRGDGRNCYDIDECAENLSSCGAHAQCVNLPGSHRCQCQGGYEFGFDGRTCVDIDECSSSPCHINARCINGLGSFQCQCRPGFYGDGFYCSPQEGQTGRPKTQCEQHRDSLQSGEPGSQPSLGAFIPQCDSDGQYRSLQCHGSTGHCWCVDIRGQERAETRTPPGTATKDCDKPDEPQRPQTHCEHHRDSVQTTSPEGYPLFGAYAPQCDANGQYIQLQCYSSTGECWCVDSTGEERVGTRTSAGSQPPDCDKPEEPQRPKTHCEHHRDSVQTTSPEGYPLYGAYAPQCDTNGQYTPLQCHSSTGHCWCVDSTGQERAGTRTSAGAQPPDCNRPVPVAPTQHPESVCERWRASLIAHYGGKPEAQQYVPQCEADGQFNPVQCYGETTYCWCVDQDGREVPGTRSHDPVKPACLPSVAPPTVRPLPRPDVTPPPNADVSLLYAQGQKIGVLPLNGTRLDPSRSKTLLTLHGSIVVGIAHDCKENRVYWTDLSARTINRASLAHGAEPEILINTNLVSPEGLAVDVKRRLMFWVDSNPDMIETANLDGSGRRTLFDSDLVNPRAIIVVSSTGTLYWTDWNREAPKIECSSVDGQNRRVVVSEGIGLPNALTYDLSSGQICWADAGTKRLECVSPDGSGRRVIHPSVNYPFSMVYYRNHFYYTDWRRDGVIAVSKDSSQFTDEYLPDQRSHLYGIAIATSQCL
ncbi:nidogen-2 isoform X4 [Notolabrus celidotus]|uniref:nidogen-2 isoform X4 n=1 Tax=Notolabrus celidotus TaxID=1203425 RepID=UPI00148FDE1D|nr:nidogen-2 isoform X4 [Notolabrus celidotus]